MIYAAQFDAMNALLSFLTENCCRGAADMCAPNTCQPSKTKRSKVNA